jgi:hypothetical protein
VDYLLVVQVVHTLDSAHATGTGTIPIDDTIPQITEGTEFMTRSITPTDASNLLRIDVTIQILNSAAQNMTVALFQDSTASALAGVTRNIAANVFHDMHLTYWMVAGTVSATTFRVRAGGAAAGTTCMNGNASSRYLGGVFASSITVTEHKV